MRRKDVKATAINKLRTCVGDRTQGNLEKKNGKEK